MASGMKYTPEARQGGSGAVKKSKCYMQENSGNGIAGADRGKKGAGKSGGGGTQINHYTPDPRQ